ncbi:hypothetical protein ACFL4O_03955, partial [bacterium]
FGKKNNTIVFGVPGNPVSNFTAFNIYIKPAIHKMMGRTNYELVFLSGELQVNFRKKTGRAKIVPSKYKLIDGSYKIHPLGINGSADIIGCTGCNCLMLINEDVDYIQKRDTVKFIMVD